MEHHCILSLVVRHATVGDVWGEGGGEVRCFDVVWGMVEVYQSTLADSLADDSFLSLMKN